jgi:ABC-type phosphate/phosphonate transport system ATPase subunit
MERRNIGMIFQSFNLVKRASVYKNVLAGRVGYHNTFETLFGIYSKDEENASPSVRSINSAFWIKPMSGPISFRAASSSGSLWPGL